MTVRVARGVRGAEVGSEGETRVCVRECLRACIPAIPAILLQLVSRVRFLTSLADARTSGNAGFLKGMLMVLVMPWGRVAEGQLAAWVEKLLLRTQKARTCCQRLCGCIMDQDAPQVIDASLTEASIMFRQAPCLTEASTMFERGKHHV